MPREIRIQYPGAWFHVMNRGAAHRPIYLGPNDRFRFLDLIDEATARYGVEVHTYCLMGNHFHLLVRTPEPNLDRFMQWFFSRYVRFFNDRHDLDGPLCRGRYKAIVVESEEYAVTLARYIHRNPLDLGVTDLANDYPWSSYPAYLSDSLRPLWLRTGVILDAVGGPNGLQKLVESGGKSEIDKLFDDGQSPDVVGSPEFVERFRKDQANREAG